MRYLIYICFLILIAGCEKVIDIDLNSIAPRYVIEASVTDATVAQEVKITRTINFSESNNFPAVSGAYVVLSDNHDRSEVLVEREDGVYVTSDFLGIAGRDYTLYVSIGDSVFESTTTMLQAVPFDSLSLISAIDMGMPPMPNVPEIYFPLPHFEDPVDNTNYYSFVVSTLNKITSPQAMNDVFYNGMSNESPIMAGRLYLEDRIVSVEMRHITSDVYQYYYTKKLGGGGIMGSPSNPISNISGGALGYFSAHTVQTISMAVDPNITAYP